MARRPFGQRLGRWLPQGVRRDLFEPALRDLQVRGLERGASRVSSLVSLVVLYLQCWWAALFRPVSIRERGLIMLSDFRQALRLLVRERGFAATAILTIALGVGANVAVFAVVEAVLLRPLPYADADGLVIVNHRDERTGLTKEFNAMGDLADIAARQSTLESLIPFNAGRTTVYGLGEPVTANTLSAGPKVFETFRLRPLYGRVFSESDVTQGAAPVVVLGHEFWRMHFSGDPAVVGRRVKIGATTREIVGVAPPGFRFPASRTTDLITPLIIPPQMAAARNNGWITAMGRMRPGTTVADVNANLSTIAEQLEHENPRTNIGTRYFVTSIRDSLVGDTRWPLTLLLGAVAVVLVIACVNVGNLVLARSLGRRHEQALRVALGAGRGRLIGQLLAESLVLALVGGLAGVAIAYWGTPALVALVPQAVQAPGLADVGINGRVLLYALLVSVISALGFGLMSALATGRPAASSLTAPARAGLSLAVRRMTSTLIVIEIALAVTLLLGAGLILRSFGQLMSVDPGFRVDRVLTIDIAVPAGTYQQIDARQALYARIFADLRALQDVQTVGAAVVVPLTGNNWSMPFERTDKPPGAGERSPDVGWQLASGGYFSALQIPLKSGRRFDDRDGPKSPPAIIVSESIERKYFPGERAVGRYLRLGDSQLEIVGVVGDIRRSGLRDEPRADMYLPVERQPPTSITLFIHTASDPARVLPAAHQALRTIEPNLTIGSSPSLREIAIESVATTRLALWLLGVFAFVALALAAVGIYGVTSYVVRQRTREIGTRLALGARPRDIAWLVVSRGGLLGLVGVALGLGVGLIAARSLTTILHGVSTWDPRTIAMAAMALIATSLAASYVPARRAAKIDPARTLTGN